MFKNYISVENLPPKDIPDDINDKAAYVQHVIRIVDNAISATKETAQVFVKVNKCLQM